MKSPPGRAAAPPIAAGGADDKGILREGVAEAERTPAPHPDRVTALADVHAILDRVAPRIAEALEAGHAVAWLFVDAETGDVKWGGHRPGRCIDCDINAARREAAAS